MFNQGFLLGLLRTSADDSYIQRVFDLYLKRHQDELLGFGYHYYKQWGPGAVCLSCGYRDLFFGKGFFPSRVYEHPGGDRPQNADVVDAIATYNPETEVVVRLTIQNSDLHCLSRLSKRGLALSVIHRQYLDRLLNSIAVPGTVAS